MGNSFRSAISPSKRTNGSVEPSEIVTDVSSTTVDINIPVDVVGTKGKSKSTSFFSKTRSLFEGSKASQPTSTVFSNKIELENLFLEKENLRRDYESTISKLQTELEKLHEESSRLQSERKLLYIRLDKMNTQMEKLKATEADALERGKFFETERDKIQKLFKSFRESKEKELLSVIKQKEQLLTLIRRFIPEEKIHDFIENEEYPFDFQGRDIFLDSLSMTSDGYFGRKRESESDKGSTYFEVKYSKETSVLLKKLLLQLLQAQDGVPSANEYSIFLVSSLPMFDAAQKFIKNCRKVMLQLEMDGRLSSIKYFPIIAENDADAIERKALMKKCANECDILVCLLERNGDSAKTDEMLQLIGSSSKVCIVGSIGYLTLHENEQLKNDVEMPEKITVCESEKGEDDVIGMCVSKLSELLQYFWKKQVELENLVKDPLKTDCLSDELYLHSFDNHGNEEQNKIMELTLAQNNQNFMPFGKEIADLQDYVSRDGPLQPYFCNSKWGTGKSIILTNFAAHLKHNYKDTCVLYHFVSPGSENSRDPILMLKRFASTFLNQFSNTQEVHKIDKTFPSWLEKACNRYTKGVIIIIDNANLLRNHEEYLKFLRDPLPVTLKVILSVCNNIHPNSWNLWPSVKSYEIEFDDAFTHFKNTLSEFMPNEKFELVVNYIETNQKKTRIKSNITNHLTRNIVCLYLQYLSKTDNPLEEFEHLMQQEDGIKMYILVILQIQHTFDAQLVTELLILLYVSRNGLSFMDLFDLTSESTSSNIYAIMDMFEKFQITWELCGLHQIQRLQAKEAIKKLYNLRTDTPLSTSLRERIIQLSMKKLRARFSSYRVADELPWQLMHINNKDALKECIENFAIFIQLHLNSKIHVLMDYWKFLGLEVNMIYKTYMDLLTKMETESTFDKTIPMLYDLIGEMFQDLGHVHFSLANQSYERSLELKETHYDSDDNRVAQSFIRRGKLYMQWEKFPSAEKFFCEAVKIKNQNSDTSNVEYMQLMESLTIVCVCQKKTADAEQWKRQGAVLRQKILKETGEKNFENAMVECASIIEDIHEREIFLDRLPGYMMDFGFIYCNLQQYEEAVAMLEGVVELLSRIYGPTSVLVGEAKCRLSYVHQLKRADKKAESLLREALGIYLENYEENSDQIENAVNAYTKLLRKQNRQAYIEVLYRQLIEKLEDSGGQESLLYAQILNFLAIFLSKIKRYEEAVPLYNLALRIYHKKIGFEHDLSAEALNNLAIMYYEMDKKQAAAALFKLANDPLRRWEQFILISEDLPLESVSSTPVFNSAYPPSAAVSVRSDP